MQRYDLAVAEIGSTTTLVTVFDDIYGEIRLIGQGVAPTSVYEGDVRIGLSGAHNDLANKLGFEFETKEMLATSSAAGGLRMFVSGLVYDMTVRAARAAALGAGAIVKLTTAGKLNDYDIDDLRAMNPNLILLAGGTDYGERETALHNAKMIAESGVKIPVIYAGNVQNQRFIKSMMEDNGIPCYITENVYPRLDVLNVEPTRRIIHKVFEEHITKAAGMEHVRDMVTGTIIPTPGAVMEAARLLYNELGDLVIIDIGGATTDVHSVAEGSEELAMIQTMPEPFAKRTVEGDLGLYVNAKNVAEMMGHDRLQKESGEDVEKVFENYKPIPVTQEQFNVTERLCAFAGKTAYERHAGRLRHIYGPSGRQTIAEGKDLTQVKYIIGTGGALTRLPKHEQLLREIADCNAGQMLAPKPGATKLMFDNDYVFAAAGVIAKNYPEVALRLMKRSLGIE